MSIRIQRDVILNRTRNSIAPSRHELNNFSHVVSIGLLALVSKFQSSDIGQAMVERTSIGMNFSKFH